MFGGGIIRSDCEHRLVVGNGSNESTLSATCSGWLLRIASQQPEFGVFGIFRQGLVDGLLVRLVLTGVLNVVDCLKLLGSESDSQLLAASIQT